MNVPLSHCLRIGNIFLPPARNSIAPRMENCVRDSFEFKLFGLFATKGEGRGARDAAKLALICCIAVLVLLIALHFIPSP